MYAKPQWNVMPQPYPYPSASAVPMGMMPAAPSQAMTGMGPMSPAAMQALSAMTPPPVPSGVPMTPSGVTLPGLPSEESYVENILRMNLGKTATIYMTFENNSQWNAKVFKGVLEAAGRDHIVISDPATGMRYLLLTLNLDYITFDEPLVYTLPFGQSGGATSR